MGVGGSKTIKNHQKNDKKVTKSTKFLPWANLRGKWVQKPSKFAHFLGILTNSRAPPRESRNPSGNSNTKLSCPANFWGGTPPQGGLGGHFVLSWRWFSSKLSLFWWFWMQTLMILAKFHQKWPPQMPLGARGDQIEGLGDPFGSSF